MDDASVIEPFREEAMMTEVRGELERGQSAILRITAAYIGISPQGQRRARRWGPYLYDG